MASLRQEELIDEIAATLVLLDVADLEPLLPLVETLNSYLDDPPVGHNKAISGVLGTCLEALKEVAEGRSEDPETALELVMAEIMTMQNALRERGLLPLAGLKSSSPARPDELSDRGSQSGEKILEQDSEGSGVFVYPDWLDETVFQDFLAAQKLNLEEVEAVISRLESGVEEELATLKRRLHTLKGESGALGMETLENTCHAIEDYLERVPLESLEIDLLLSLKDWISDAVESYAELRLPLLPDPDLLRRLGVDASLAKEGPDQGSRELVEPKETPRPTLGEVVLPEPFEPTISSVPPPTRKGADVERDEDTLAIFEEFLQEGFDGQTEVDEILLNVEQDGVEAEKVDALFRVFHTLKGVAGFLELDAVSSLAHTTETLLNQVRGGSRDLEGAVLDLVFDANDMMGKLLGDIQEAVEKSREFVPRPAVRTLVARLRTTIDGKSPEPPPLPEVEEKARLGEILVATKAVKEEALEQALESQKSSGRRLGEELVASGATKPKEVAHALRAQNVATARPRPAKLKEMLKVDLARVDQVVEMIGELVIVEAMVAAAPELSGVRSVTLRKRLATFGKISRDLQTVAMQLRMIPLRGAFQKMGRLVRDVSKKSGKDVRLVTAGESIEMDRAMVEQISDPLVHLIRNAVDHGIEPPEERAQLGKTPQGQVQLAAYHQGSSVVIEIRDDGRGLDREKIVQRAIERGLVREDEELTEQDIFDLIFAPGFSTAASVTQISGRGVGMDVVKKNVEEALRGRIAVESAPGLGSTIKLILPLTLAIIDGMLVSSGGERYVIPTLSIVESFRPTASMLKSYLDQHELIDVRGEVLPLFRLDRLLEIEGAEQDPTRALVVILESMGHRIGLMVDDVLVQQQVVKKSLGPGFQEISFVAGATILSDGHVGLILNVDELPDLVSGASKRRTFGERRPTS